MLPGVYMVKFDMLNPNLTSKATTQKNSTRANKHEKHIFYKLNTLINISNKSRGSTLPPPRARLAPQWRRWHQ